MISNWAPRLRMTRISAGSPQATVCLALRTHSPAAVMHRAAASSIAYPALTAAGSASDGVT